MTMYSDDLFKGDNCRKDKELTAQQWQLVVDNRNLIHAVVRRFEKPGTPMYRDAEAAAEDGLIEGVKRFDPNRGYKLSTYVNFWIYKFTYKFITEGKTRIHVPGYKLTRIKKVQRAIDRFFQSLSERGLDPADDEQIKMFVQAELGITPEDFDYLRHVEQMLDVSSLLLTGDDGDSYEMAIACPEGDASERAMKNLSVEHLIECMNRLTGEERAIVAGAMKHCTVKKVGTKKSLERVADELGLDPVWVRSTFNDIRKKLEAMLNAKGFFSPDDMF